MSKYEELTCALGKLKRNEEQMSDAQRVRYKDQLAALRKKITSLALSVGRNFIFSGMRVERGDVAAVERIRSVVSDSEIADAERGALDVLFSTYDADSFLMALLPLHQKLWYLGYGPYWVSHCTPVDERDGDVEFSYYNDIIDMFWISGLGAWKRRNRWEVTLMLPPTMEIVMEEYRKEIADVQRGES